MRSLVLITGASGFVGTHAIKFALAHREKYDFVLATDVRKLSYPYDLPGEDRFRFVEADFTKSESMSTLMDVVKSLDAKNIWVWHIGGLFNYTAQFPALYRVNVEGTDNLIRACREKLAFRIQRLIFWSGGVVYGDFNAPGASLPADESYPVDPQNPYGLSKMLAEKNLLSFHRDCGFPVTIMRNGAIYGEWSKYGMANAYMLNYRGYLAPLLVGDGTDHAALIYAGDAIRVADFLGSVPESNGEIYNVVDSCATMDAVSSFIGEQFNNKPWQKFHLPKFVLRTIVRGVVKDNKILGGYPVIDPGLGDMTLLNSWVSNKKLMALAEKHGVRDTLLEYPNGIDGLRHTIAWFKAQHAAHPEEGWL
ncbi:MAG: NAD(P)-dependent oxidoreductase [bacterium]|nr:NAD(P)-dependent oxidoreductase [bacterium]